MVENKSMLDMGVLPNTSIAVFLDTIIFGHSIAFVLMMLSYFMENKCPRRVYDIGHRRIFSVSLFRN